MVEQKINSLQVCMKQLETTLKYLEKSQNEFMVDHKESLQLNAAQHREILDKIDVWISNADKNYAGKWVENDLLDFKKIQESRNYDWLKYGIITIISIVISIVFSKYK